MGILRAHMGAIGCRVLIKEAETMYLRSITPSINPSTYM